jgi:hypothetical protein
MTYQSTLNPAAIIYHQLVRTGRQSLASSFHHLVATTTQMKVILGVALGILQLLSHLNPQPPGTRMAAKMEEAREGRI